MPVSLRSGAAAGGPRLGAVRGKTMCRITASCRVNRRMRTSILHEAVILHINPGSTAGFTATSVSGGASGVGEMRVPLPARVTARGVMTTTTRWECAG